MIWRGKSRREGPPEKLGRLSVLELSGSQRSLIFHFRRALSSHHASWNSELLSYFRFSIRSFVNSHHSSHIRDRETISSKEKISVSREEQIEAFYYGNSGQSCAENSKNITSFFSVCWR